MVGGREVALDPLVLLAGGDDIDRVGIGVKGDGRLGDIRGDARHFSPLRADAVAGGHGGEVADAGFAAGDSSYGAVAADFEHGFDLFDQMGFLGFVDVLRHLAVHVGDGCGTA